MVLGVRISKCMQKDSASARNYCCSFHPEVFRVSQFSQGTEVLLLASSSKDNTRGKVGKGRDEFLWLLGLWKDKLYFHLFTSGTGLQLVC